MNPLLQFDKVGFTFGDRRIFDDLTFKLETGGCMALIGPNGVGKTTLLRLATGLLKRSSGSIFLQGRSIDAFSRKQAARRIALVPQTLDIPFEFTVEQIVRQGRTPHQGLFTGASREDYAAVERAIELTDTQSLRHRIFNELSGGERQRVKIALGLAQEAQLLLLDEPTQNLDIGRQIELLDLVQFLHHEGLTIFAAMHDLQLIAGTFSSVLLLRPGQSPMLGHPRDVLRGEILERAFNCPPRSYPILIQSQDIRRNDVPGDTAKAL